MKMFQCDLEEGGGFMFHTCYNEEDLEPYNCKRSQFEISVSGKRQILLFSEKRFEFLPQDPGDIETCHQFSNLISCKVAWDIFAAPNFWIKSENNWRSMFDRWDFAKTYRRSGSATTKTGVDWPKIGNSLELLQFAASQTWGGNLVENIFQRNENGENCKVLKSLTQT